jgi:hypothetical protein
MPCKRLFLPTTREDLPKVKRNEKRKRTDDREFLIMQEAPGFALVMFPLHRFLVNIGIQFQPIDGDNNSTSRRTLWAIASKVLSVWKKTISRP